MTTEVCIPSLIPHVPFHCILTENVQVHYNILKSYKVSILNLLKAPQKKME